MFVSFLGEAVHFKASEMMLQLLRGTRSCDYRSFVSDIFKVDLIEVLWWEVSTSNSKVETMKSSELRDLWYSLLNELCCNRDSALAIMEKDFLERFIVLESSLSNSGLLQDPANTSFLRLVSSVFHATNLSDHERYFKKAVPTMEILAELCLCTIVCIFDMNEAKWNATEVLYALAMHQDTLIGVWKACYLYPTQISDAALVKGTERLCAVSEMLLQCGNNVADLILVLTAVLKICRQSIDILIRARNLSECWPMINVLVQVLQQCISDPSASSRSYLRPIVLTTSNPADFLPYYFPTELHVKATVLALQLVQLCLADRQFTESLETESDLLRNLFVCIATSNWRVASAAAIELSTLIHCDPDVTNPEDDEDGVTRYMCDQGDYRYLEFFSDFATQEVVRVAPSSRFPPCFVLLVRWLRFYSVNVTLLSDVQMVEDFAQELESTKELAETTQLDVHEKFAGSILEILLYLVANYHSVIYTSDNSESEEKEHSLFLQSLLALCQRRPRSCLDNADTCIVSSCRVRSRALKLVQLLCSIDLPHTRSVQVFSNPQQMQILMMIVENSTSDVEQNSAAQLMEALALKDPVKNVLIRDTSLLFRLGAWLEIDKLQLLAAAIIQRLATPSSSVLNRSVFGFSPSIQQQLAHFLIVGVEQKKPSQVLPKKSKPLLREVYRLRIEMQLEEDIKRSPRQKSSTSLLSVQLRLEIVDQSGLCLRQFEYQATVRSGDEFCYHEFLMEPAASIVRCTILTRNAAEYEDPKVRELELSRGIGSSTHRCDSVLLRFSEEPLRTSSVLSGILSRLLRQEIGPLSFEFFQALSGIVAEFCRDYSIFCDPVVDLPSQILVVLATSVEFAPAGKMDVTCLENLTTWFPNKPTVSNFKSIAPPVLHLIQNLRQLACIGDFTENLNYGSVLDSSASNFPQFWFLEKFVEFIGDVEVQDLTANVLNALFIENSDLLLYVCGQFNSEQSSETTFLSLVAIAIRRNVAHCQSFLSPTAQTLLRSVFDAGIQKCTAQPELQELLSVLTVNRKKALTSAIRVATQNARVLMAFHSMTSLALDFYIDTAKKLQNQKKSKLNSKRRVSAIVNIGKTEQTVFLEWLLLLEQLAGLLCSGLHELDAVYYMEIVSQFRSLILDLPLFLRKMECMGTHSRREALMLFLDNLHRLVKRATNRNELRVVAANGSGIVDQTKAIRARLRKLDVHISTSLAALLEAREVEKAMASSRESISLLKKIKEKSTLKVCDGIFNPDPFSDDAAMILLRRKLEAKKKRKNLTGVTRFRDSSRSAQYRYGRQDSVLDRLLRGVILVGARLILLIAFWRQEELRTDLKDPIMAKAFDDPHARDEYYRLYHAKKGLGELVRVWMPTSGRLGLQLWQERHYALIGTLVSVTIVLWLPAFAFPDGETNTASKRNTFMTRIVYGYGIGIFLLAVVSIALIAQNRFVLLEQTRLRLRPVSRYYQNVLAVTAIGVELVQINSLAFDSAVDWDSSDELPATVEWLGNQGITKFGFSSAAELEALGVLLLLLFWFLLLKCANKFRETSALLHRVLTKDLPALVHGFLYMSTISVFFSYLACMDCSVERNSTYEKCKQDPQSPPFLIAHKEITCWTAEHQWYALLGLWGITFFLPIGLLAHGMSQVLFQRETLDIKYAPVLILVVQLVKAAAATAQAFFPSDPILLASLGAVGNAVLLVLTLAMHSYSLWYIKYLKCGIYAASCWASLGAIHRLQYTGQSSTRSLNIIYFGWLSIGLTAASAILARVWLRARAKQRDTERHFAAQQRLLNADKASGILGVVEQKFMSAASKRCDDSLTRAAFISNARRLGSSSPPPVLKEFIAKASAAPGSLNEARGVLFVQSSRVLAKKLREHEELRRRW
ncbi:hypothetical protein PC122_g6028 [Phytophthora cactorum]|nr:hypothetical protein PC122_g6028 [Phytophthora cactorum]